jgi:hypothetical protein
MKGYFQTTLAENKATPQNAFIGSITSEFKPFSSMCMLGHSQAFIEGNCDFLDTYSVIYYKIITLYLNGVFLKCI